MDLISQLDHWAAEHGDHRAHVSGASVLTYSELKERSDRFAAFLIKTAASEQSPVAILGHKQAEMLVGFIGSLKAGHPYIPLDSSLPAQRVRATVEAARAVLYTVDQVREAVAATPAPRAFRPRSLSLEDLWYIIFTSGSTGDPKGVMITRGCLESFLNWTLDEQRFEVGHEVFLNQAPFSFDLSVMDLYSSLATGGTLFSITQADVADPRSLFESLGASGVTVWVSTPSFARMCLMQPTFNSAMLTKVRKFWFCGETLAPEIAGQLLQRFPEGEVWNTYGPTEATVATTSIQIGDDVLRHFNPLPVGRTKPDGRVLVLDESDRQVAPGGKGEIAIAGPNVALGYINAAELTARAFGTLDGQRMYRTGDAGHFEGDLLFFDGRLDFQIKLHGYRIELGDVEANIRGLPGIQDAVVLPVMRLDRAEYLVAFTILSQPTNESDFDRSQRLRQELGAHLPEYMVPRRFVFLTEFPITRNGKLDRQKLARTLS